MRRFIAEEPRSRAALWSRRCALFALALAAIAFVSVRLGAVDVVSGLAILGAALVFACAAVLLAGAAIVIIWRTGRRGSRVAWSGFFLAVALLGYPGWLAARAVRLPLLSEVSTDVVDPPAFSRSARALAARGGRIPTDPAPQTRDLQKRAYPDVEPVLLELPAEEAYQQVLVAAAAVGWKIIDQVPPGGRAGFGHVDALDRSLVMGFPSDIAIRIRPLANGTRIDVRSASSRGFHDFGANAARIVKFSDELEDEVAGKGLPAG